MAMRKLFGKLLLLPLLGGPLSALADPVYSLTFLPADFQASISMNNAGRVAGGYGTAAAIWSKTGITNIGAIAPNSIGYATNNRGDLGGNWQGNAFVYSGGAVQNIGRLGPWSTSFVSAMNDVGQAAGNGHYEVGERQNGFVYSDGALHIIPTFGGDWSWASAINNSRQVAGTATIDSTEFFNPTRHAIIFRDGVTQDLGSLGGLISEAQDINDAGQVVGMSETTPDYKSGEPHPFLYENGVMRDLGFLGGVRARALGINNAGLIVGTSEWSNDNPNDYHAFLYKNHTMVDLNTLIDPASGWRLTSAMDINDAQQILATACRADRCATVRLDLISAIPEPQVWGKLLVGLALVGSRRRRGARSEAFS